MTGFLTALKGLYRERVERRRNRQFLDAAMAACALVTVADGSVRFSQRVRVDQVMEALEELKVFDPHVGVNLFNDYVQGILSGVEEGRARALRAVEREIDQHPEKAEMLIRICLAVSEVDGEIPLTEQVEIVGLCNRLGVNPGDCGLYTDSDAPPLVPGSPGT